MEIIECRHGDVKIDSEDLTRILDSGWNIGTKLHPDGYINVRMYKQLNKKSKQKSLSRFIIDAPRNKIVTFRNKNTLDLRKKNLLVTTNTGKRINATANKNAISIYKGVYRWSTKFTAQIRKDGKSYYIGNYSSEIDAAKAYDKEAFKVFGPEALLNFPN